MTVAPLVRRALVAALASFLAVVPLASHAAGEPVVVTALVALTGSAAFLGKEEQSGLSAIEALVNKSGGIGGRPLQFEVQDTQSSASVAVQLANRAIQNKVPVMLGASLVGECSAIEPLVKSNGPVTYCFSPGIHPTPGSYMFSSGISTTDLLAATARYFRLRGWKKVAIITSTDATGQDAEQNINEAFSIPENRDEQIVLREHFNTTDISVSAQMSHIQTSGAQALIAWTSGSPLGTLLRGAADAGLEIPILTTSGNLTYAQMKQFASFMPKQLYFPGSPGFAQNELPNGPLKTAVTRAVGAFKAAGIQPDEGQYLAWDGTMIVVDALRKLGPNATAAQIRSYIDGTRDWYGMFGKHDYRAVPQRGVGIDSVIVVRWDAAKGTWVGVSRPGGAPL